MDCFKKVSDVIPDPVSRYSKSGIKSPFGEYDHIGRYIGPSTYREAQYKNMETGKIVSNSERLSIVAGQLFRPPLPLLKESPAPLPHISTFIDEYRVKMPDIDRIEEVTPLPFPTPSLPPLRDFNPSTDESSYDFHTFINSAKKDCVSSLNLTNVIDDLL